MARTGASLRRRVLSLSAVLLMLLTLGGGAPPAAAVGPSMQLSVGPQSTVATPTADAPGEANFTGALDLFNDPVGQATINVALDSNLGWTITPSSFNIVTRSSGHWDLDFTVEVPPSSNASQADTIEVTANYRVGGVTTGTQSTAVHAVAGGYYLVSARQASPPGPAQPSQAYWVDVDVHNDGNAPGTFAFVLLDDPIYDRMRSNIRVPDSPTIPGHGNVTAQFVVTPGPTSPGGAYGLPVRIEVRDRTNQVQATTNFTLQVEVNNLAVYQGILPNWDMRDPYTLFAYFMIFLGIWFVFRVLLAARKARKLGGSFLEELSAGVRGSLLARGVGGLWGRLRKVRVKRPDEIASRARASRGR